MGDPEEAARALISALGVFAPSDSEEVPEMAPLAAQILASMESSKVREDGSVFMGRVLALARGMLTGLDELLDNGWSTARCL